MENNIPWENILKQIKSRTKESGGELNQWLKESKDNQTVYNEIQDVWKLTGSLPEKFTPDQSRAWQKIHNRVKASQTKKRLIYLGLRSAAAVLFIFINIWVGMQIKKQPVDHYTQIIAPNGQKTKVVLPDSSLVWLNGGSSLKYFTGFNHTDREVILSGEGFFDVQKDSKKQFVVHAADIDVKVFGTVFNVKSYGDDEDIEVELKSGSVRIDKKNRELTMLKPGELANYNKSSRKLRIRKIDPSLIAAWTHDELIFDGSSFKDVVKYLERWYGVEIELDPRLVGKHNFTFKVKTESLSELLNLIKKLAPIDSKIEGKHVQIIRKTN